MRIEHGSLTCPGFVKHKWVNTGEYRAISDDTRHTPDPRIPPLIHQEAEYKCIHCNAIAWKVIC